MVGNEFQQRAVRVAEIDAGTCALCAEALDRTRVDGDAAAIEVSDGVPDRPIPLEAQIAVAGRDRDSRHFRRMKARSMEVELRSAETVGPALRPPNELGAEHVAVERVGALPFGYMHDAVVEAHGQRHSPFLLGGWSAGEGQRKQRRPAGTRSPAGRTA